MLSGRHGKTDLDVCFSRDDLPSSTSTREIISFFLAERRRESTREEKAQVFSR